MMSMLMIVLMPAVVHAAPARKPVIALLPVRASSPELTRLGLLMEARASELLAASGQYSTLDAKQVRAMGNQEGIDLAKFSDDAVADRSLVLLGADRVVAVTLSADGANTVVQGSVRDGDKPTPFTAKLPAAWSDALTQGSEAIAQALLSRDKATLAAGQKAQPESKSDAALKSLGTCWETGLRQPLSIDAPVGLSRAELDSAIAACQAALKADPSLRYASATLALLQAIGRKDAEADTTLGPSVDTDPALMPWMLGRLWLLTRHKSNEAAVTFLTGVIKKNPNRLVLRSYMGSLLTSMNEHARAVTAWNDYLALAPASAFAQGRLSRSQARLGKMDLALAAAKKGLTLAPDSREARLALASRQLDAEKLDDAKTTLEPLVALPDAPAEPILRLGWAYWMAGDAKKAAPLFKSASERATGPKGWKIKGRAFYNLALVEAKQGHLDLAKAAYAKSLETGLVVSQPDPLLADVVKAVAPRDGGVAAPEGSTLYVSMQTVDKANTLSPAAAQLADTLMHEKLSSLGASFAPANEDKKAALAMIEAHGLKGYELRMQVSPGATGTGLKLEMLVMSYPEQALKGSWSVKAASGKQESLVKAMIPRVIDDAAGDLEWKN